MKEKMKMENTNFIIYKAQNILTGECYIGATTKSIEERKQDHIQKAGTGSSHKFHYAISTTGADNFKWEQLDTASNSNELAEKETKYIYDFKAQENGYNSDRGGGIKKTVYQYNLDGSLNTTFKDLTKAGDSINVRKQDISRACWSMNHSLGGYLWSYEYREPFIVEPDNRKKEVVQYNLDNEELARFVSASEAARKTGISKTCITRCCRDERKNSGGYIWKYL